MIQLPAISMERLGLAPPKLKPGFFVDYRKGEAGELRLLLRKMAADYKCSSSSYGVSFEEDHSKCREILKRLIRCMTLGVDVSRLYTDVVMISHTTDPVQKKMIYMFLSTYSKDNPDLTVLTINTLLKDVDNVDPVIRCLALRNLSAFDTQLSNDYARGAILKKFYDPSDAVKRSAIIGSLRIYKSQCALAKRGCIDDFDSGQYRSDILQHLKSSLKSINLDVMFDSMCVYGEMMESDEVVRLSKPSIVYMVNRMNQMNEWEQCLTLKALQTYTPSGDELFDMMNLLDGLLKHTSTAVFLATAKCFLSWTANDCMLQLEVIRRLEKSMIALIAQSCNEIAHNLLINTLLLIVNAPRLAGSQESTDTATTPNPPFADHYETFFCRYDDPVYTKHAKINILVAIACESNSLQILNELNEYFSDTNHEIATKSVKAAGVIALKFPAHLEMLIQQMSAIFSPRIPHLNSAVLYVIRALLRVYPDDANKLLKIVEASRGQIKDPQALGYYIWILGEFGDVIEYAPYILEDIIDQPDRYDVTKELLCASMKVFFKRPPEMFPALYRLFDTIMTDSQNPELTALAGFYHSLLAKDIDTARKIVTDGTPQDITSTLDNMMVELGILLPSDDWRDLFNSLDLFEECQSKGKANSSFFPFSYGDVEHDIFTQSSSQQDVSDDDVESTVSEEATPYHGPVVISSPSHERRFVATMRKNLGPLNLVRPITLLSDEYQKYWSECNCTCQSKVEIDANIGALDVDPLEDMLFDVHIATLASGTNQATTKMYQYAQDADHHMYYIEVVIDPSEGKWHIQVSVKTQRREGSDTLSQLLSDTMCNCVQRWIERIDCM